MTKADERRSDRPVENCSHCSSPVQPRRPSKSGLHFCSRPECKAAKQREYQARRLKQIKLDEDAVKVRFLHAALYSPRMQCPGCGLVNALPGFAHRRPDDGGCEAVGYHHPALKASWVDTVWPDGSRVYAEVESP